MLVVGSRALQFYIPNLGRILHDWDIWMCDSEYTDLLTQAHLMINKRLIKETSGGYLYEDIINGNIIEIKVSRHFDPTDVEIFNMNTWHTVKTPFGVADIPSFQVLFDIKASTAEVIDEPKHKYDVELMKKIPFDEYFGIPELRLNTDLFKRRLEETKKRAGASKQVKYDFFHKYQIPEYVLHDELHVLIADLMDVGLPTYQRITSADVAISEDLFNNLTHAQKISLMVEESLVLNLERWFIPQMVEKGINYRLIDMFYNNNEAMPTYKILKHCCITGLKGEAEYIVNFARENFFEIEKEWRAAKEKIKQKRGFPSWFYDKLFELRDKFKAGEKVAIV